MRAINNNVHRSGAYEDTLQILGGSGSTLFPTLRDALGFAATLGYREGRRLQFDKNFGREDLQPSVYVSSQESVDLIFMIGLAESKSTDILKLENEKECIKIFEEYANGGLALIAEWLDLYPDISVDDAVFKGLKSIGFKAPVEELNQGPEPINAPDF
jgi:dnd system-associated protein 4